MGLLSAGDFRGHQSTCLISSPPTRLFRHQNTRPSDLRAPGNECTTSQGPTADKGFP
ncbi:hypothetical protein AOLI_G00142810, partial [Acnodon oligacanthus]